MGGGAEGGGGNAAHRPPAPPPGLTFLLTQTRRPHQIPPKLLRSEVQPERFTGWEWGGRGVFQRVRSEEKVGGMACGGGKARQDVKDWNSLL